MCIKMFNKGAFYKASSDCHFAFCAKFPVIFDTDLNIDKCNSILKIKQFLLQIKVMRLFILADDM